MLIIYRLLTSYLPRTSRSTVAHTNSEEEGGFLQRGLSEDQARESMERRGRDHRFQLERVPRRAATEEARQDRGAKESGNDLIENFKVFSQFDSN